MARKFVTPIDLAKNELQNAVIQNLASAPSSPVKGQLYFNTTGGDNTLYWYDGTAWIPAKATASVPLGNTATSLVPGNVAAGGASANVSREDHVHGLPGFGTITAQTAFGAAKSDGAAGTFARSDHAHGTPTHDAAAHSTIPLSALAAPTANVPMGGFKLTGVGTPTAGTDAVTKDYADNLSAGLSWKETARIASTANLGLTSLAAVDGVTPAANDRVLVKNQTTSAQNGIYLAQSGAWTRATDADAVGELEGAAVFITEGTTNGDKAFVNTTDGPITPGTTPTTWVQFGAGTAYSAGNGLTLTGSTFDVVAADASIVVTADAVAVGFAGSGSAVTAARSDHNHAGTYAGKYAQATVGGATSQVVTHNLNTRDVVVNVYRTLTPWDTVECDVERTTANTVTLRFAVAPATNEYSVVVIG